MSNWKSVEPDNWRKSCVWIGCLWMSAWPLNHTLCKARGTERLEVTSSKCVLCSFRNTPTQWSDTRGKLTFKLIDFSSLTGTCQHNVPLPVGNKSHLLVGFITTRVKGSCQIQKLWNGWKLSCVDCLDLKSVMSIKMSSEQPWFHTFSRAIHQVV